MYTHKFNDFRHQPSKKSNDFLGFNFEDCPALHGAVQLTSHLLVRQVRKAGSLDSPELYTS